jgi:hypothetical protein
VAVSDPSDWGDKTGQWKARHERAIPHAEELYAVYFKERAGEEIQ